MKSKSVQDVTEQPKRVALVRATAKCEMGWPPCKRRAIVRAKRRWQNYWFKCCTEHAAILDDHDYEKIKLG